MKTKLNKNNKTKTIIVANRKYGIFYQHNNRMIGPLYGQLFTKRIASIYAEIEKPILKKKVIVKECAF